MMNIRVPEVQTCCCCISLRTGAKFFGFMSLVAALFITPLCIRWMYYMYTYSSVSEFQLRLLVGNIVIQAVQMTTSFLLLLGVYQAKGRFILPWLTTTVVAVILELVVYPSVPSFIIFTMTNSLTDLDLDLIVVSIFTVLDDIYGWLVVFSYYRSLVPHNASIV